MKRSAGIFRERWGEQFVGNGAIGLALSCVSLPLAFLIAPLVLASPWLGMVVAVLMFGALIAIGSATSGIFNAALYRFATTGQALGPFAEGDLSSAFRPAARRGTLGSRPPVPSPGPMDEYLRAQGLPTSVDEAQRRAQHKDDDASPDRAD